MIEDWKRDENGNYYINVRFAIDDVLTWSAREHLSWTLVDTACAWAKQYIHERLPNEGPLIDYLEGEIKVAEEDGKFYFIMQVRLEPDSDAGE